MKKVKLHLPKELEDMFNEPRPELIEASFTKKDRGQVNKLSCPYISHCIVRFERRYKCRDFKNCQSYKFYNRYGKNYDEMFIG
jgi:hypothetical protein